MKEGMCTYKDRLISAHFRAYLCSFLSADNTVAVNYLTFSESSTIRNKASILEDRSHRFTTTSFNDLSSLFFFTH